MPDTAPLAIGDRIKDNDLRSYGGNRVLTIIEILPNGVIARQGCLRPVTIRRDRIYTDGKSRQRGFSLLPREAADATPA